MKQEHIDYMLSKIPMGRFGRPDEVSGMVLFLASELANYITGASIDVSGALNGQMTYLPVLMDDMRAMAARRATGQA